MELSEVESRIEGIRAVAGDDEVAHSREDELRDDVLKAIAEGASNAAELAGAALSTRDIEFARWCA